MNIFTEYVFMSHGLVPLIRLKAPGNRYVAYLCDHLQPFMDFMYTKNDGVFM